MVNEGKKLDKLEIDDSFLDEQVLVASLDLVPCTQILLITWLVTLFWITKIFIYGRSSYIM